MTRYEVYASTGYVGTFLAGGEYEAIHFAVVQFNIQDLYHLAAYPAPHTFNEDKGLDQ